MKVLTSSLSGDPLCYVAMELLHPGYMAHQESPRTWRRPVDAVARMLKDQHDVTVTEEAESFRAKFKPSEDFGPSSPTNALAVVRAFVSDRAGAWSEVPDDLVLTHHRQMIVCNGVLTTGLGVTVDLKAIQATLVKAASRAYESNDMALLAEVNSASTELTNVTGLLASPVPGITPSDSADPDAGDSQADAPNQG